MTKDGSQIEKLEDLYRIFNVEHPHDFSGHSLSVSDIVALKQAGVVSYHYVDSIGYKELTNFRTTENYLKNAEMQMEDDFGMIDGIINNGRKKNLNLSSKRKKRKPRNPLFSQSSGSIKRRQRKTTQHRSAERDLI